MKTIVSVKLGLVMFLFIIAHYQLKSQGSDFYKSQIFLNSFGDTMIWVPVKNIRTALFLFDAKNNLNKGLELEILKQQELLDIRSTIILSQFNSINDRDTVINIQNKQLSYFEQYSQQLKNTMENRTLLVYGMSAILLLSLILN